MAHQAQPSPCISINIPGRAQQVPDSSSSSVPPQNIHYLEDSVQEDAKYQVQWSNWMEQKSFYKHVFVLLLSWHPECDDMDVEAEVKRLQTTFESKYNYVVESFHIDSRDRALPQVQVNSTVANFVHRHDQDNALFIIYYAGHGSPGRAPGTLNMSARRSSRHNSKSLSQQYSHITWNLVESNLKTTRADIFLIFDCCYASDLGRGSTFTSRSFEYLAATETGFTRSPGPQSFTSALIWALDKLSRQPTPMFLTSKLAKTICECPEFPQDQKPPLTTRDCDAWKHIFLAPLPREGFSELTRHHDSDDEEIEDDNSVPQFLSLTFQFKHRQEETELRMLADHIKTFMKTEGTALLNVKWSGTWMGASRPPKHRLRQAVLKIMSQSPTSASRNPTFPSRKFHGDRLAPQWVDQPGISTAEQTPLLSGASSAIFEQTPLLSSASSVIVEQTPIRASLWDRFVSFFRGARKPAIVELRSGSNNTKKPWTNRFKAMVSKIFKPTSSRVQIPS